jgi:hypothetical protein
MSIVSDALKKAHEKNEKTRKDRSAVPIPIVDSVSSHKPVSGVHAKWIALAVILLVSTLGLGYLSLSESRSYTMKSRASVEDIERLKADIEEDEVRPNASESVPSVKASKGEEVETIGQVEEEVPKAGLDLGNFHLSGIVFGAGRPFAVINKKILEKGDSIGDAEIVQIERESVTLLIDEEEFTLKLK